MTIPTPTLRHRAAVLASCLLGLTTAHALDLGPVSVRGSSSLTAAYSPDFNYLGDTNQHLGLVLSEASLNASYSAPFGVRFSTQFYAYKLEDYSKVTLDFLNADYSWKEWFGIRVGRNRTAGGLYNESRDVDAIRVFAFLPLGVYDPNFRPLRANHDGVDVYGNVNLGKGGSFEYQAFYGKLAHFSARANFIRWYQSATPLELSGGKPDHLNGYTFVWNTPLDGLRLSATEIKYTDVSMATSRIRTSAQLAFTPTDLRALPFAVAPLLPPGVTFDQALAGAISPVVLTNTTRTYSAEYTHGDWVFAYETQRFKDVGVARLPIGPQPVNTIVDSWYLSASWQATKNLGLGAYYEEFYPDARDKDGHTRVRNPSGQTVFSPAHSAFTKGWTAAASYKITNWWLIKGEVHLMQGTAVFRNDENQNGDPLTWQKNWSYFVIKNTFSF